MDKTKVISFLVEPLNGEEKDSMLYVYMRMINIFNSCTTIEQLENMKWWAWQTFEARFPGNYSFFTALKWTYRHKYEKLIDELIKNIKDDNYGK